MNKRLKLAVLAQAVIDAIDDDSLSDNDVETALTHLSAYPALVRRLRALPQEKRIAWKHSIERAMGRTENA